MVNHLRTRFTGAMALRMLADAAMVQLSVVLALVGHLAWNELRPAHEKGDFQDWFRQDVNGYLHSAWFLTIIALIVYSVFGFYTYGRHYLGRYKSLVISQAVVTAYIVFGFITYMFWDRLGLQDMPRWAMVFACGINLTLALASRTFTYLWERVVRPERLSKLKDARETKRVLVIGGAGYIGSALLPKLLARGYRVRLLDLFLYGTDPISSVADHPNLELMRGDFRHVEKAVEAMRDMDAVIHLGAVVGDPACDLDPKVTLDVNLTGTQMLAQVAKASGISRFIFASTCSVYGACDDILNERSEVKPISLYGNTKLAAERGLLAMADGSFLPTILRFATIYGLSGRTRFDLVINLLAAKAKIDGVITVHGGDQWRPFVHVDDAALGVLTSLEAPISIVGNQIYNVGSDEQNYTIRQVGEMIHEQVFSAQLSINDNSVDKRNYRVSFAKIRNELGFKPKWTVEKGILQVLDAVANGRVEDYKDARYSNVKFLSENGAIEVIRHDDEWTLELLKKDKSPEMQPAA